jgi:DNA-binding transcriptional LysR family regulator
MDIRQLRYFVAVAEDRHFRRAAERIHVAQPAISESIRKLEAELGVRLLDRTSRSVDLTPAGSVLLDDARRILRDIESVRHAVLRAHAIGVLRMRLGFTLSALPPAIGTVLGRLRTADARIDVDLDCASSHTLLRRVRDEQLDVAVVCLPAATAGLRVLDLGTEPLMALLPAARHTVPRPVRVDELAHGRVLLPRRELDPACHDAVLSLFRSVGVMPDVVESAAATLEQLLLEVLSGGGTTILPASAVSRAGLSGLVGLPIAEGGRGVPMGAVTRDELPGPVLARLLDELRHAAPAPVMSAVA